MKARKLREHYEMGNSTKDLLKAAIAQFNLSAKRYDRMLKVSRTIPDLKGAQNRDATVSKK